MFSFRHRYLSCAVKYFGGIVLSWAMLSQNAPAAAAGDSVYATTVVKTEGSPITLTHCGVQLQLFYSLDSQTNLTNRTDKFLTQFEVRWTIFDHAGLAIGQQDETYNVPSLAPRDTYTHEDHLSIALSEPFSAIAHATCRLQSAKFEGGRVWRYGRGSWSGHLAPLSENTSSDFSGTTASTGLQHRSLNAAAPVQSSGAEPKLALAVTNAWNDSANGRLFVHVALDVHGASADTTLRPAMLSLQMSLANGAKKNYGALLQGAPTYEKMNPLGQSNTTAYEVDPKEDLGALGSLIVPAQGVVHVVATFDLGTDVVADPDDNRRVVLQ